MNRPPVISICIPAYRRSGFLKRLLDSLISQTYPDYEIVLTDDSPDDEVGALVRTHPLHEKIRYIRNPVALGTPENWNEGLRQARGEWIKIMHDDDWFSAPDSLERFAAAAKNGSASFYYSDYRNVLPDGKKEKPFFRGNFNKKLARVPELLLASNRIGPPSVVLFRADPSIRFDRRMKWLVDIDFYLHYLKTHPPAVYLDAALVNIGISESQVTRSSFGNPEVEIPERMLLGGKTEFSGTENWMVYDSWWRFVRNMKIRTVDDIDSFSPSVEIPDFLASIINFQRHLPEWFLKTGGFSKVAMTINFIRWKLK